MTKHRTEKKVEEVAVVAKEPTVTCTGPFKQNYIKGYGTFARGQTYTEARIMEAVKAGEIGGFIIHL